MGISSIAIKHFELDLEEVQTNIVVCGLRENESSAVSAALSAEGVLAVPIGAAQIRFVTHRNVSREEILKAIDILRRLDQRGFASSGSDSR